MIRGYISFLCLALLISTVQFTINAQKTIPFKLVPIHFCDLLFSHNISMQRDIFLDPLSKLERIDEAYLKDWDLYRPYYFIKDGQTIIKEIKVGHIEARDKNTAKISFFNKDQPKYRNILNGVASIRIFDQTNQKHIDLNILKSGVKSGQILIEKSIFATKLINTFIHNQKLYNTYLYNVEGQGHLINIEIPNSFQEEILAHTMSWSDFSLGLLPYQISEAEYKNLILDLFKKASDNPDAFLQAELL